MSDDSEDRELIGRLRSLPAEVAPDASLEGRVESALRGQGLLRPVNRPLGSTFLRIAAGLTLIVAGFAAGDWYASPGRTAPRARDFALLLYRDQTPSASEEKDRVREYGAWARKEAAEGHLLNGERLADAGRELEIRNGAMKIVARSTPDPEGSVRGFFLIRANTESQALEIAGRCPHLKYGGRIELRQIDVTTR